MVNKLLLVKNLCGMKMFWPEPHALTTASTNLLLYNNLLSPMAVYGAPTLKPSQVFGTWCEPEKINQIDGRYLLDRS